MTRKEKEAAIKRPIGEALDEYGVHARDTLVKLVLAELEAAGQKWDPEEPRLPKRLVRGFDRAGSCLWPLGERGWKGYSPKATEAAYDKAARAYNILPEIEEAFHRWQDEDYGNFRADENFAETLGRLLHGEDGGS